MMHEPLVFKSKLSMEEIERNFEGVNVGEGIVEALKEAISEENEPCD